jgi:hypothetical protein
MPKGNVVQTIFQYDTLRRHKFDAKYYNSDRGFGILAASETCRHS